MSNALFLSALLLACLALLAWGFRVLPGERWQMLATLPLRRLADGRWEGINLTWYGLLTANAYLAAVAVLVLLLGTVAVPLASILTAAAALLLVCVPASRLVARLVEGKAHIFTVGGAVFVGLLIAPWLLAAVNHLPWLAPLPVLPTLAAVAVAYAFGEGLGRLACISFGCCYGKPLAQCGCRAQKFFHRRHFVFFGATKKIAYADGLEGVGVVPVQGLTALLYCLVGVAGTGLFLAGEFGAAFVLATFVTQGWRVYSETLRADYRGTGRISAYQLMALAALPYALAIALFHPAVGVAVVPELHRGFALFGQPFLLRFLQMLWLVLFIHTGRSSVTGATLSFHVHPDRI